MTKFGIFIDVQDKRWKESIPSIEALIENAKTTVLKIVQQDVWFLSEPKNFTINLVLSDDETVHQLNKKFRGIDSPTNVLSFANIDDDFFDETLVKENDVELGDVIVAYETMKKQAEEIDVPLKDHFCHLWVHGILHILGFDHIQDDERAIMEAKEIEILKKLGIENPYQE